MNWDVPLERIIGRRYKGKRGAVNRFKNFGGGETSLNVIESAAAQDAARRVFELLSAAGSMPAWGPNGQIVAKDPTRPGKLTTSIPKLRKTFDRYSSAWYEPCWDYYKNVYRATGVYRRTFKNMNKYGNIEAWNDRRLRTARIRYLRQGYRLVNDPSYYESKVSRINAFASRAAQGAQNRASKIMGVYNDQKNQFTSMYGGFTPTPVVEVIPSVRSRLNQEFVSNNDLDDTVVLEDMLAKKKKKKNYIYRTSGGGSRMVLE